MIIKVVSLEILPDYRVKLGFNTNETKVFDYAPHINDGVFKKLKNKAFFATAQLDHGTVAWNGNLDFAPEFLYERGVAV
ncbi:MAG: DUF2442 domain-containing protein [Proteobacteria bacterium]|nr:DUF2442 domain-containing protein [Pseudomonadota bacterium]